MQEDDCEEILAESMQTGERWYAVGVTSRHEKVVAQLLTNKEYETFLPLQTRQHQYGARVRNFELPLFPGYVFCKLDVSHRLPVLTTPGVLHFVGAGKDPIAIRDEEIEALQKAIAAKAALYPHPYWKTGERGSIKRGPLKGLEGIVVSTRPPIKLLLSITLLQRSVLVEVDADCVAQVA